MYVSCNINVNTINIVPDCSNVNHMIASFATITLLYIICHDIVEICAVTWCSLTSLIFTEIGYCILYSINYTTVFTKDVLIVWCD